MNRSSLLWSIGFWTTLIVALAAAQFSCGNSIPQERAVKALEAQGFSDVKITKRSVVFVNFCGCDQSDIVKFDAMVTNSRGERVHLIVCGGIFKGMTIRYK